MEASRKEHLRLRTSWISSRDWDSWKNKGSRCN